MVDLQRVFHYVQKMPIKGMYRPQIEFITVDKEFELGPLKVELIPIEHGPQTISAYLISDEKSSICYAPDCSAISEESINKMNGVDVMILDALRHRPHPAHLTIEDSIAMMQRIGAKQSYATHIAHDLDYAETEKSLPAGINLAYDGLVVEL
jgi:phosphoribosyl 1,2-cyclic phosphate phosphodiesterase